MKDYQYFPINRQKLVESMAAFAAQKPGFDKTNYYNESSYKSDYRVYKEAADKNRRDLRDPKNFVFYHFSKMDDHSIHEAFRRAFAGRLSIKEDMSLDYTAGQYWCTEYQNALLAVVDWITDVSYAGLDRERFYEVSIDGKNKSLNEVDLCNAYEKSLSKEEKLSLVKSIWGEIISDGYTSGGGRKMVEMEEYSGLSSLYAELDRYLAKSVGYAIEGLQNRGWIINGFKDVDRFFELTTNGHTEILKERDFREKTQELTGLSSERIDITLKAITALKDRGFNADKLEYFPQHNCFVKIKDNKVLTAETILHEWKDITKDVVVNPEFKESLQLRFGEKVSFLNDPSIAMKAIGKNGGTLLGAVASLSTNPKNIDLK